MSNKANAARYGGSTGSPHLGGGGSGIAGIMDMFMEPQRQVKQHQYEIEMENLAQQHLKEQADLAARISKDKDFRDAALKNSPPGSYDQNGQLTNAGEEFLNNTALQQVKNMTQTATMESNNLKSPEGTSTFNRGKMATMLQPEVANSKLLEMNTPEGNVSSRPPVPGIDSGGLVQQFGANKNITQVPTKMLPQMDKKGNITSMTPYEYGTATSTTPGKVVMPQKPISPQEDSLLNGGGRTPTMGPGAMNMASPASMLSMPQPPPSMGQQQVMPQDNSSGGRLPAMPSGGDNNSMAPWWGPEGIMNLIQKYLVPPSSAPYTPPTNPFAQPAPFQQ